MKFETTKQVKTWLRGLALLNRDLEMKTGFYLRLQRDCRDLGVVARHHEAYYLDKIEELHKRMQQIGEDVERLMECLDPEERAILTARYIKHLMWDAMEFYVHFSRRHAIRIHDRALKKLIGQEVEADVYRKKDGN